MNPLCVMCNPAAPIQAFCSRHALEIVNGLGRPVAGECRCPAIIEGMVQGHQPGCLVGALVQLERAS